MRLIHRRSPRDNKQPAHDSSTVNGWIYAELLAMRPVFLRRDSTGEGNRANIAESTWENGRS